eukprot:CAMPEP_0185290552 /NCGR_PEP_ID=MMETSP1363-20130426/4686_1 /TAXON_ID=38817 /ORGANISM="Gephyrocapsa oceanica, Strain RCC1303" /LENGTH=202 /DNA_ID=CAMNT_0027886585 /DNA_START=403 /DNA_END=1007 /DNA_ORIENTATION=-
MPLPSFRQSGAALRRDGRPRVGRLARRHHDVGRAHQFVVTREAGLHLLADEALRVLLARHLLDRHVQVVVELFADRLDLLDAKPLERRHQRGVELEVAPVGELLRLVAGLDGAARAVEVVHHGQQLVDHLDLCIGPDVGDLRLVARLEVFEVGLQPLPLRGPLLALGVRLALERRRVLLHLGQLRLEHLQLLLEKRGAAQQV